MMKVETIKTKRCLLHQLTEVHLKDVSGLYTDEKVMKYLGGARDPETVKETIKGITEHTTKSMYWAVYNYRANHCIGLVSLTPHHDDDDLEISYLLYPDIWGKGYATEVVSKILNYGFSTLQLTKIVAETQTANTASCKLLEKLGMNLEKVITRFGNEQAVYAIESSK